MYALLLVFVMQSGLSSVSTISVSSTKISMMSLAECQESAKVVLNKPPENVLVKAYCLKGN